MTSKELSIELRDRIVSRHRSGEVFQFFFASLKVPKNTASSIIKWKKFGNTKTLLRAGRQAKLNNQRRRALVKEVTKNTIITDMAPEFLWENLPEGQTSLQHSTNQAFMVEWPDRSHSSVKGT